jgi:hypothetical protein
MLRAARRRFNATAVVAVLALVLAMSGGALAAGKYLITSTKQIKPSVLAQLRKSGPAGAKGANGTNGVQGPAGAPGTAGKEGVPGKEGKEGVPGKEGKAGQTGFTEVLPAGKTETGTWAENLFDVTHEEASYAPISFSIPLSSEGEAFYLNAVETAGQSGKGGCKGTAAEPAAPAGVLCIYTVEEETVKLGHLPATIFNETPHGFGKPGTYLEFDVEGGGQAVVRGTWAVTG